MARNITLLSENIYWSWVIQWCVCKNPKIRQSHAYKYMLLWRKKAKIGSIGAKET